jgi:hypothetical protein
MSYTINNSKLYWEFCQETLTKKNMQHWFYFIGAKDEQDYHASFQRLSEDIKSAVFVNIMQKST